IVGRYAFERYVGKKHGRLTDAARAYRDMLPERIVLPHPSPRNNIWLKTNPWFEREVLVVLRARVRALLRTAHD
ncbi:MAG: uracil-DNA glycosylase family protein, partial [Planctomycetota bacterium]